MMKNNIYKKVIACTLVLGLNFIISLNKGVIFSGDNYERGNIGKNILAVEYEIDPLTLDFIEKI